MIKKSVIFSPSLDAHTLAVLSAHLKTTEINDVRITYLIAEEVTLGFPFCTLVLGSENPLVVELQSHAIATVLAGHQIKTLGFVG